MMNRMILSLVLLAACGGKSSSTSTTGASSIAACPANIPEAVSRAYPGAQQQNCESETESGKQQFEVEIAKADGTRAEIHLAPNGTIIKEEPDND